MFTLILLVVVAGTASFAWFKLNQNAWFDDMELDVSTTGGIKISVDGVHFKNNLTKKELQMGLMAKSKGYDLTYVDDKYMYSYVEGSETKYVEVGDVEEEFSKRFMQPVHSKDGQRFYDLADREVSAQSTNFVYSIDIYFIDETRQGRVVYFSPQDRTYEDGTFIPATTTTVANADTIGWPENIIASFSTYDQQTGAKIDYDPSGDPIENWKVLASGALRYSVRVNDNGHLEDKYRIYELDKGNGSYATTLSEDDYVGAAGAAYDSKKNAGFTYYNNVQTWDNEYLGGGQDPLTPIDFDSVPETYKGLDNFEAAKIVALNEANHYGFGGTVKMNMNIWIDGWDADCFDAVWDQRVQIKMSFTSYEVQNIFKLTYRKTNPTNPLDYVDFKTTTQIDNMKISDDSPVFDDMSTGGEHHKFVGWAKLDQTTGDIPRDAENKPILWDFSQQAKASKLSSGNDIDHWILVSVWDNA